MTDTTQHIDLVEECGRALMVSEGCGLTLDGRHVFCDDNGLMGLKDGYGDPLRREQCDCKSATLAVLTRLTQLGMLNEKGLEAMKARKEER